MLHVKDILTYFAAVSLAIALLAGCAAQTAPEEPCKPRMTLGYWESYWSSMGVSIALDKTLPEEFAGPFLARFNATPPVSFYNREQVKNIYLVAFSPENIMVISHDGDCITLINKYSAKDVMFWLGEKPKKEVGA